MSRFTVTRSSQAMVLPSTPTPPGKLPLSPIDKTLGLRNITELLQVFQSGRDPARLIRESLAAALVPYYPVAGRVLDSIPGAELHVACTGEGVWFSEATVDCSLEDVNYLSQPLLIPVKDLLPTIDSANNIVPQELILMIQVTEFTCGGFTVCFGFNHVVFDGFGIMNFFRAVGEMARGLRSPVIEPIWCREIIPGPPPTPVVVHPSAYNIANLHLQWSTLDMHVDSIMKGYMKETNRACSEFDVLVAILWQCRTRAINPELEITEVHLSCPANARPLLHELMPRQEGYYGNCTFHAIVSAPAHRIKQAPVTEIVGLILDAKERIPGEFWRWMRGELGEKSIASFCNYETIMVIAMGKLGCKEVDYGWGAPVQTGMIRSSDHMASCVIDTSPKVKGGVRITGRFVREEHLKVFHDEMNKAWH